SSRRLHTISDRDLSSDVCSSDLVCTVIATLFLAAFASFDASVPVALFFVAAMVAFFAGLVFFLREIFIATANLRIGPHLSTGTEIGRATCRARVSTYVCGEWTME